MNCPLRRTAALLFATAALAGAVCPPASAAPGPDATLEAECSTRVRGSHATADCFNGNSTIDRVQLHIECVRWWDPDMDTAPVAVTPARHVSLTQRCWLGIRHAWVTHTPG
ncbi:hypothetical protein AB0H73_36365 [Streptomyces olivoreticuli]|uniref:Secreted protein n=1 Tax=Streptomyces blastmyceticus TaxID=68180 RepID=A0ABN0WPU9_9ACTN|nr:hypothetical protein [Streptomyces olivoreticuli]